MIVYHRPFLPLRHGMHIWIMVQIIVTCVTLLMVLALQVPRMASVSRPATRSVPNTPPITVININLCVLMTSIIVS